MFWYLEVRLLGGAEVMRWEPSWVALVSFSKRPHRAFFLLLPYEDTATRQYLWARKQALTRHRICRCPDLRLPSVQNCGNKFLLFRSHPIDRILLWQPKRHRLVLNFGYWQNSISLQWLFSLRQYNHRITEYNLLHFSKSSRNRSICHTVCY